jgi:hypothetical protein
MSNKQIKTTPMITHPKQDSEKRATAGAKQHFCTAAQQP